jgi:hypothetical protein
VIAGLLLGAAGSALFLVLQKRTTHPESVNISWGGVVPGDGPAYPVA